MPSKASFISLALVLSLLGLLTMNSTQVGLSAAQVSDQVDSSDITQTPPRYESGLNDLSGSLHTSRVAAEDSTLMGDIEPPVVEAFVIADDATVTTDTTVTLTVTATDLTSNGGIELFQVYFALIQRDPLRPSAPTATPTPTPTATATAIPTPTATPTPSCLSIEEEPNNTSAQTVKHLPPCEGVWVQGTVPENDPGDIYRIQIAQQGTLEVDLANIPAQSDYQLFLYNSNGFLIADSINSGNAAERIEVEVPPDIYNIFVFPVADTPPGSESYSLRWQLK